MPPDDERDRETKPSRKEGDAANPKGGIPRYAVPDLLGEAREAILLHDGAEYRLRITSRGRLILTK